MDWISDQVGDDRRGWGKGQGAEFRERIWSLKLHATFRSALGSASLVQNDPGAVLTGGHPGLDPGSNTPPGRMESGFHWCGSAFGHIHPSGLCRTVDWPPDLVGDDRRGWDMRPKPDSPAILLP
ncbi:hypothetical protein [Roseibium algae]|uniref:Uncharacterized protein n=1 Tax=Roseibium algae TaxID=3123038 RepID=A0ABU8THN9_9HYPH